MRKGIVVTVIVGLLVSLPTVCFAANDTGLKDLKGHWSEAQVTKAVKTGWVNGYPDKTFRPEGTITRAEFTKMALAADRLIPGSENAALYENDSYVYNHKSRGGSEFGEQPQRGLVDISDHWLTKQGWTKIALNYGMLVSEDYAHSGYKFNPDKPITRYEMAIIMDRMLGLVTPAMEKHEGEVTSFTDDGNMKDWQKGYVLEAVSAGVIQGYPDGSFHGEKTATRAEAVTMVQNALDYMETGVDERITVKLAYDRNPSWEKTVPNAVCQVIDGKIYVPMDRCFAINLSFIYGDLTGYVQSAWRAERWAPVRQGLVVLRNVSTPLFTAGISTWYNGFQFAIYMDEANQSNRFSLSAPVRMLYGHPMAGLIPLEQGGSETLMGGFPESDSAVWDPQTKTVTFRITEEDGMMS